MTRPVISLKPSYNSVIRGCPGLPETLPRVECELRIRSNDATAFKIDKIEIILKSVESLMNTSHHSFSSKPKLERTTTHYKKSIKISEKKLIGIDIPLTIGLPDNIKETNFNHRFGKTVTFLECSVRYNGQEEPEFFSRTINVERYTFLPSAKLFPSLKRQVFSPDKKFVVSYKVMNPCVTKDDILHIDFEMKLNPKGGHETSVVSPSSLLFSKKNKAKLKAVSLNLKEFLEVYDDGTIGNNNNEPKENVLHEMVQPVNEMITNNSIRFSMDVRILTQNELFKEFEDSLQEPLFLSQSIVAPNNQIDGSRINTRLLQNKMGGDPGLIPFQYHTSITTDRGNLFRIIHGITIKFKIGNGKSFQVSQSIDITPWKVSHLRNVEQLILQERETAKYAKLFYENFGGLKRVAASTSAGGPSNRIEYPPLPPVVYPNDSETLKKLDIEFSSSNSSNRSRIPLIE